MDTAVQSMNDDVWVQLTLQGEQAYQRWREANEQTSFPAKEKVEGGWTKWYLWELFQVFGPYVSMTVPTPFLHNRICFERPKPEVRSNEMEELKLVVSRDRALYEIRDEWHNLVAEGTSQEEAWKHAAQSLWKENENLMNNVLVKARELLSLADKKEN